MDPQAQLTQALMASAYGQPQPRVGAISGLAMPGGPAAPWLDPQAAAQMGAAAAQVDPSSLGQVRASNLGPMLSDNMVRGLWGNNPDAPPPDAVTAALMQGGQIGMGGMPGVGMIRDAPMKLFHGTREPSLSLNNDRPLYLTTTKEEAQGYAAGGHLGGSGNGPPKVHSFDAYQGKILDINDHLMNAMDMGDDVGDAVDSAIADAKKNGYRYVKYDHPSFAGNGDEQQVIVSLYPKDDLYSSSDKMKR